MSVTMNNGLDPKEEAYSALRAYVDEDGDVWLYIRGRFRYLREEGEWSEDGDIEAIGQNLVELSEYATIAIKEAFRDVQL
ncbi:hypothetical protein HOT75_gp133 [Gordonia phage Daredevil]|uniref:Uncharacterized protein n=1 Tax=Gordonia phage Daredevil TaxID=2283286 RepID=A0A345MIY8_9CAUD|nr:hypothetical protein HOT75_gp133 [Gordonia phage Daredevil]AXH70519.1 hypothetical protein SEA_DAREDEVIL_133 [Gordonia phage Daredevil]